MAATSAQTAWLASLGARIRQRRQAAGWSQRQLASASGLSLRFLGQLEGGSANVSLARLAEVAAALEVSLVCLLAGLGPVEDAADQVAAHVVGLAPEAQRDLVGRVGAAGAGAQKLALIGLRGAGKSTIGAAAAASLECPFVVVDERVRERAGMPLADVFEVHGAEGYHRLCHEVLTELVERPGPTVLEVGGSVVADEACWGLLAAHTRVVWLRASAEEHLRRVAAQGDTRPMRGFGDALPRLRQILEARQPLYARAPVVIDTEALGVSGAAEAVVAATVAATVADARSYG